jgi:hypothetical protein
LRKLNDELHELRLNAGFLSARAIRDRVGKDVQGFSIVSHQAVLDAFQKPELPALGRLEVIVGALAEAARHHDVDGEVNRFKDLWKRAAGEVMAQASVGPQTESVVSGGNDEASGGPNASAGLPVQDTEGGGEDADQVPPASADTPLNPSHTEAQINYAEESLKGLIINAAQALWQDKDALRVFLGVVRRSKGFARMADVVEELRPANATYYGVKSREFEVAHSEASLELITLKNVLEEQRSKLRWSFTTMEEQTGISADDWIRWYTQGQLPTREAVAAFSHAARLTSEDHILLLGLWDAAHDAVERQKRLDAIPVGVTFAEAWMMRDPEAPSLWALAGVGDDGHTVYGSDLARGTAPAFVVAGPAKSGRSTALMTLSRSLLDAGARVVLVTPRPSPLRELADRNGVVASFTGAELGHDDLEQALSTASIDEPIVVVMDDAEVLVECEAKRSLSDLLHRGFVEGMALILAGHEDELRFGLSWLYGVRRAHRGLLLAPQSWNAGDLIGIRTGSSIIDRQISPGRGWLHLGDGRLSAVTVPR